MPRKPHPWYRESRAMWFITVGGKQVPLGVTDPADEAGAVRAWQSLTITSAPVAPPAPPPPSARTVSAAVAGFVAHCGRKAAGGDLSAGTLTGYRLALAHFSAAFGDRAVDGLTPEEIEGWARRPSWSASTRNTYLGVVQTLLKWAKVPLRVRRPPKESRGADTCLTDEQFDRVIREAVRGDYPGDLRELLRLLRETGARPGEVTPLRVEDVDWGLGQTRREKHKTRRHTGRARLIVFNSAATAVLRAQRERYGSGLLFRTRYGGAFRAAVIVRRLLAVSERVGFRVIAYGLGRHSFCTRALTAGVPDAVVAGLMGHKGTGMIERHYNHLNQNAKVLRDAAERVVRG